jgi:DHA1 family bicyclomycin/chloramphenicol resistance-like MFS transporter
MVFVTAGIASTNAVKPTSPFQYVLLVVVLGGLTAMGPLAIDMYLPSFPAIAREFDAPPAAVQATVSIYFIGLALGQLFYGPLSDRIGRRGPLFFGLVLFIGASIGCAFATSVRTLIGWRIVQALGGCAEMMVARAVVRDRFDARDGIRVLSLLILVMGVAPILAPLAGGQLLVTFGWRSIFWALAGYGTFGVLAVALLLPESLPPERRRRDSLRQVFGVYGTLIRDRGYMAQVLSGGLIMAGMFAYIATSPFVFIELFHVPPQRYGLYFGTNALGLIAASQVNGRLARQVDPQTILRVVLPVTAAAGLVLVISAYSGALGFAGILVPLFVCVASVGFILPNTTVLAMAAHGRVAGSASALLGTVQFLLGAAAASLAGALGSGTAVPLAVVVAGCACGALLINQAAARTPLAHLSRSA